MRIFKTKTFAKYAKKQGITNEQLLGSITDIHKGIIDCDYNDGLIKQRIARVGQGKSSGHRVMILFQMQNHAFFVHGFAKKDTSNLTASEIRDLKKLLPLYFNLSESQIQELLNINELIEVTL